MTKDTFQRFALVTIVVLLAAIAGQRVMAFAENIFGHNHDHDFVMRHLDVGVYADEQRELADEARALAFEARQMAEEGIQMHNGVCDLSEEAERFEDEARGFARQARHVRDQLRVEIR